MTDVVLDRELVEEIAARLDLREPNREALESIALELSEHYDIEGRTTPFEGVVDVATGVGKTYIMAAAIDYLAAARGIRNFAIITPGRTILNKSEGNFTLGAPKSLVEAMAVRPVVITSENFNTPAMRAAMDDPEQVKLYIFTVQALTKPQTETGRKTHKFQEGLGQAFYAHLVELADLVLFADEHHTYYGEAFSKAIRDLSPYALLGLTATPHKKTPEDQIIYRYPLAAAIAARLVKTPVIVGRQDDRSDTTTKLLDGIRLLEYKRQAMERYCAQTGKTPVNPVMLVIAKSIEDAEECRRIVEDPAFAGGAYAESVLVIHSDAPDAALEALDQVEDPASPVRIIISVGMLKEGWDVKNVYVIVSLRASISDILTEQTLGRGLRLAFGAYTGVEILDALEVLAHERYEELLRRSNVLNEAFIDFRTRAVVRANAFGQQVVTRESSPVEAVVTLAAPATEPAALDGSVPAVSGAWPEGAASTGALTPGVSPRMASMTERQAQAEAELTLVHELLPREDMPPIHIPKLVMTTVQGTFSLADITDLAPFEQLGRRIAADPVGQLRRTAVGARILTSGDGARKTELVTTTGADVVYSQAALIPLDDAVEHLRQRLLAAPVVPARKTERNAAEPLLRAFLAGLGAKAEAILSAYGERAADELIHLVTAEHRRFVSKPQIEQVVEVKPFAPVRTAKPVTSANRYAPFSKTLGYEGWARSMYTQAWFDSEPERAVANMLDAAADIACWVRLAIGDLPILWSGAGNWYHPDFIACEQDSTHWIVEVKSDKELEAPDVRAKSEAAKRWANHVSADPTVGVPWRYLLVSESEVQAARGSWAALKQRGL